MKGLLEDDKDQLGPAERAARDAVRALGSPRPDPEYRRRVALAFASGSLQSTERSRPFHQQPALWSMLAAAAALVVVAFGLNRGPDWRVVDARGTANVIVDGKPVALQGADLSRALRRGAHVTLAEDATLELVAPGMLAMNIEGGSDVVLPEAPNRWWSRAALGRVNEGSAYITTGGAFHGARLAMQTPEAVAHVTGTSLAVLRDHEAGTCVCVMQGQVVVSYEEAGEGRDGKPGPEHQESLTVPAGKRCICPLEGEAEIAPILRSSEHALHALGEKSATALGR